MTQAVRTARHWPLHEVARHRRARIVAGGLSFVLATAASAYVAVPVPWSPVPMTLQPMVVILAGAVLGPWGGAAAMASYLSLGALGLPVFSGGNAGLAWMLGPTGGYLVAFPAAAFVVGLLVGRSAGTARLLVALAAGVLVLYAGGVSQLYLLTREELGTLLRIGVLPFVLSDLVKVLLALALARAIRAWGLGRS